MIRHKGRLIIEDDVCDDVPFENIWDVDAEENEMEFNTYLDYDDYEIECDIDYGKECDKYYKDFVEIFNKR